MEKNPWNKTDQWNEELEFLKSIVAKANLFEDIKWGGPVYSYNGKNILGIGGFKSYFGIWFFNGVFLKDEQKLLINAQEGTTKSMRQMRFNSINEIDEKVILQYIKEAISIKEKVLTVKSTKKKSIQSDLLNEACNLNDNLKNAFNEFKPYKQSEFIEYIESAKQEKTKLIRLEKIKPMILSNTGLNDKYRK
ncbi:YdeI/OmpD-associated family protein [Flavobacterium sp.]|uniref:YdeI/OmpD-associated family protein n=1 Tax=Flavobacterium sp. TaxID=239 RepID=UPI003D2C0149